MKTKGLEFKIFKTVYFNNKGVKGTGEYNKTLHNKTIKNVN